jgi:hypothetical protein
MVDTGPEVARDGRGTGVVGHEVAANPTFRAFWNYFRQADLDKPTSRD